MEHSRNLSPTPFPSPSIGFTTKVSNKSDSVDLPFYVTAHETGISGGRTSVLADVEGETSIDETMAQYTALMVMKHHFGPKAMKKFLRFELDQYLRGRAKERNEEKPLKGRPQPGRHPLLKGRAGDVCTPGLHRRGQGQRSHRGFLKEYAFKGPPYPTSLDLEGYFSKVTPPEYQYLFEDMFREHHHRRNRALSADY